MFEDLYSNHIHVPEICREIRENKSGARLLKGLSGSSPAMLFYSCFQKQKGSHLIILPDKDSAAYFLNDLSIAGLDDYLFFFPSSWKRNMLSGQPDEAGNIMRTKTLQNLSGEKKDIIVISYPEALVEKAISPADLQKQSFEIKKGEKINSGFLEEVLQDFNFSLTDFVYQPGQYAIRGSIIDVFSFSSPQPFRIDFFGNEIESIRTFDIDSQLSVEMRNVISIIPDIQWTQESGEKNVSLTDYFPDEIIWIQDQQTIIQQMNELADNYLSHNNKLNPGAQKEQDNAFLSGTDFLNNIQKNVIFEFGNVSENTIKKYEFNTLPQIPVNHNFKLLASILKENSAKGYRNIILSENQKQIERIEAIFKETDPEVHFEPVLNTLHEGFSDSDLGISIFTDHQIFDRYHRYRLRDMFLRKESLALKEINNLNPGDYVVHTDHGIGIFGGLETIEINGKKQETVRLVYKDHDILYVNIHSLHRISKFKGGDGEPPKIYKLGTGAWAKLKQNARKKIKDIAFDLISLYAQRLREKGFSFTPDTYLQQELEASFIYEDTPDQLKATIDVKNGMEAEYPMDRLICGDVGFGKTEIAIRAAFKAVTDSKQVIVLVPTTLLAFQHYNTFTERLKNFPCNVDYLTRLRKPADQKRIKKQLEKGEIDIIIGTHKLLGNEIKFKDPGLLIIDEEQKFGVAMKEKLRKLRLNIDTLTLTATPIPRTLQFSLMGARDLSVINTPPPNRHPIITESHVFNEDIIREAIEFELNRGGQVFFIHNRIQNILELESLIKRQVKNARTVVAHGQMEGRKLEDTMLQFITGDYDVLVATTIIESGLDIPNANTIIINDAHHFGLSELHQLRGRVGRSNKKAFCYLLAPPPHLLTPEARRRIKAIEENSELGSGFSIALQDLDIRGAGNLLGAEQSGFIAEIGIETYRRILQEAMLDLKENEFKDLFKNKEESDIKNNLLSDCQIDTDLQVLIPETFISNTSERLKLYKELDNIIDENELEEFAGKLQDRFGPIPKETIDLMDIVRMRKLAVNLGFEKITIRRGQMLLYFIQNAESDYFNSEIFKTILDWIKHQSSRVQLKENGEKLILKINKISSVENAFSILKNLSLAS